MTYRIAVVGTGDSPEDPDSDGFAMAYRHAAGYRRLGDCQLVACADIVPENATQFADRWDVQPYEDYEVMLREADPDIVSVTVPPAVHAEVVEGCADYGDLEAVHCEKPMATTWADCRSMTAACRDAGVTLTINHQRRLAPTFREAKSLLDAGKIGDLRRVEWSAKNLFDSGTHLFDLSAFYTDAEPEWVLAGLDYREENRWFGTHNENQAVATWRYDNGVHGLAATGEGERGEAVDPYLRLVGADGRIEVGASDGPTLRYRNGRTLGWKAVNTGENMWGDTSLSLPKAALRKAARALPGLPDDLYGGPSHIELAVEHVVKAVQQGRTPELAAERALRSTELIFGAWESVRRRGRVDLPLDIEDNPLEAMVEDGSLPVGREQAPGQSANGETASERALD